MLKLYWKMFLFFLKSKSLSFGVETFILEKVKKKFFNMFRCYEHVFIYFAKQSFKNVIRRRRHKMKMRPSCIDNPKAFYFMGSKILFMC